MPTPKTPDLMNYNWENVPRDLIERAKKKLAEQDPPGTLKWKLIELLRGWVDPQPTRNGPSARRPRA